MSDSEHLYSWVMVRLLPPMPPVVFARFDNPADAKGYGQVLKALMPGAKFLIFLDHGVIPWDPP